MKRALVFTNKNDHVFGLVDFAQKVAEEVIGVVATTDPDQQIQLYSRTSVKQVYRLKGEISIDNIVDLFTYVIKELSPDLVILSNTKMGRIIAPRVAQRFNSCYLNDVIDIRSSNGKILYQIQALGSMAVKIIEPMTSMVILTISPPIIRSIQGIINPIKIIDVPLEVHKMKIIERVKKVAESSNIEDAEIIVSVGRGIKSKDDLNIIYELAKVLNAEVGCSRPLATDLKWMDESRWIGLSGKKVKPKLYIAIGISGQPQHIAGIMKSKIIVSINKDENAPINRNADYVIVADLYQIVPELINLLKKS